MTICRSHDCVREVNRILKDGYCLTCNKMKSISKELLFQIFQPAREQQLGRSWEVEGSQQDNFLKLFKLLKAYQTKKDNTQRGHNPLDWLK